MDGPCKQVYISGPLNECMLVSRSLCLIAYRTQNFKIIAIDNTYNIYYDTEVPLIPREQPNIECT